MKVAAPGQKGFGVGLDEVKAAEFPQDGAEPKLTGGLEGLFEALRRAKIPGSGVIRRFLALWRSGAKSVSPVPVKL